jgi:hypothetical protein
MAAVRRVRKPGCKFDEIMVWENEEQGGDKSSGLATLAVKPEWFSDNLLLGASARETIEALSGHWIIEVSELQGMSKSEVEKVKAFASRSIDRARMVWDRTVTEARRQCIIIGTTNSERYLRDLTGNRRFWPVRVGRIDLKALERDRDQLWAEAAAREAEKGASIRLPQRLWPVAAREQQARVVDNPFVSVLDRALREGGATMDDEQRTPMQGKVMTEDLWTLLGLKTTQRTQPQFDLLGDAMKQLGWEKTHLRAGGPLKYYYTRGPKPHRHIIVVMISAQDGTPAYPVANYADGAPVNTEATEKAKEAAKAKEGTDF